MNASAIHSAVRSFVRDGAAKPNQPAALSDVQRAALRTWRRRASRSTRKGVLVLPPVGSAFWT